MSRTESAYQKDEIAEQNYGERQRGQKCEVGSTSFEYVDAQYGGDQAAGNKPQHQFTLQRGECTPGEAPCLHRHEASRQNRTEAQKRKQDISSQPGVIDQRAQQDEEKRAQQKGQLPMEREHLAVVMIRLVLHRRFAEPVGAGGFIEVDSLADRGEIREREAEEQDGNKVIALKKVDAGINQEHGGER